MTNPVRNITFWVFVLVSAGAVFGQPDQGIVRLDLKDSTRERPPDTLQIYVEIATVQPDVEQGIVFTLNIENNSTETIRIIDPIDTARIALTGFTRPLSMSLRNIDPDFALCISRPVSSEQVKAMSDDKKTRRPFQAFDTYEARRNRRLKTVSDIIPWEPPQNQPARTPRRTTPLSDSEIFEGTFGGKLILEPGERFQAVLQVTKVYSDYEAYKKVRDEWLSDYLIPDGQGNGTIAANATQRPEPEIIPIPSGKYSLSVSIVLLTDNGGPYIASHYAIPFDKLIIQLGQPTNSKQKDTVRP